VHHRRAEPSQCSEFAVGQLTPGSAVGQFNPECSRTAFGQLTPWSAWWVLVQYQRKWLIAVAAS
jgi:hypothetical protein